MANVLIIDSDDRLAFEQIKLLNELDDRNNVDHVRSFKDFEKKYFLGETDDTRLSVIDLIIFKVEVSDFKLNDWIQETKLKCKNNNYISDDEVPLKFIIVKYEDDGIEKSDLIHRDIYDIIYTPLDRLLYLQKLEITLALPGKVTASFLFTEKIDADVHLSKKVVIDQISSVGFSIINPANIRVGTHSGIYLQLQKDIIYVHAQVIASEPITDSKSYRIYFSFYGINRDQYKIINRYVKKNPQYSVLKDSDDENFLVFHENVFLTPEEKRPLNIIVIDDLTQADTIKKDIESSISFTNVQSEETYSTFYAKYIDDENKKSSRMSTPDDIPTGSLIYSVNNITEELTSVKTTYTESDQFLGNPIEEYFKTETHWKSIFNTKEAKEALAEALNHEDPNSKLKKVIAIENSTSEDVITLFETFLVSDNELRFELKPLLKTAPLEEKGFSKQPFKKIDLIIADKNSIGEMEGDWTVLVKERLKERGLLRNNEDLQIIIIDEDASDYHLNNYASKKFIHNVFLTKPTSTTLTFTVAQALKTKFTKYCLKNIAWIENNFSGYIAKPAKLNSISEFGASITAPTPVADGVVLYLHGHIFENAPGKNLAVRFYHHQESQEEKEQFTSHFLYFGITDQFLKFARKWIKDNYANQKSKEGN